MFILVYLQEKTFQHYDASSAQEKLWLKSLSRSTQVAEVVDLEGGRITAGVPPSYNYDDEDLQFLLADMKSRVEAIEYEIERRLFEPEKIVFEFIGKRFKPVVREGYSQEHSGGF